MNSHHIFVNKIKSCEVPYTARPKVTPPQATNCLLERIGGTSLSRQKLRTGVAEASGLPDSSDTTSPFNFTSYWGPDGSTKIVRRLEYKKKLTLRNKNTCVWTILQNWILCVPCFVFLGTPCFKWDHNALLLSHCEEQLIRCHWETVLYIVALLKRARREWYNTATSMSGSIVTKKTLVNTFF